MTLTGRQTPDWDSPDGVLWPRRWVFTVEKQENSGAVAGQVTYSGATLSGTTASGAYLTVYLSIAASGWSLSDQVGRTLVFEEARALTTECLGGPQTGGSHPVQLNSSVIRDSDGSLLLTDVMYGATSPDGRMIFACEVPGDVNARWIDVGPLPCPLQKPPRKDVALQVSTADGEEIIAAGQPHVAYPVTVAGSEYVLHVGNAGAAEDGSFCGWAQWAMYRAGFLVHTSDLR